MCREPGGAGGGRERRRRRRRRGGAAAVVVGAVAVVIVLLDEIVGAARRNSLLSVGVVLGVAGELLSRGALGGVRESRGAMAGGLNKWNFQLVFVVSTTIIKYSCLCTHPPLSVWAVLGRRRLQVGKVSRPVAARPPVPVLPGSLELLRRRVVLDGVRGDEAAVGGGGGGVGHGGLARGGRGEVVCFAAGSLRRKLWKIK